MTGPRGGLPPTIIGGVGTREFTGGTIKGAVLQVDGILYVTAPDNVWALDALDGREIWHYFWRTSGATHIGNRGAAIWRNYLFFETPDNYLVSLDAKTGKERWHVEIADFDEQYFSTPAPDHRRRSRDRRHRQRSRWPRVPAVLRSGNRKAAMEVLHGADEPGDPGSRRGRTSKPRGMAAATRGCPDRYDPETKLYIFGTGNPSPAYTGVARPGDNLFTCALVAVHVDTGKMAWHYQMSPHDTHDWDTVQTPMLIDAAINGKPRKLVSVAARNGYFFTVDRVTGEHIVTTNYGSHTNWAGGLNSKKAPVAGSGERSDHSGRARVTRRGRTTNWQPPAYSPDTGLFYTQEDNSFNMLYLTDPDPRGSMGLGGKMRVEVGSAGKFLTAIDPATGKVAWRRRYPNSGGGGIGFLATAGGLLFGGDGSGNLSPTTPKTASRSGTRASAPSRTRRRPTCVDGKQYVLIAHGRHALGLYALLRLVDSKIRDSADSRVVVHWSG